MPRRSTKTRKATTRYVLENQSIQRRGHAGDIAGTILFLISENAGFITGQTINVDGGWVMQ
jgi:3-oxoacyl-[acyl-carrier protein] reductase